MSDEFASWELIGRELLDRWRNPSRIPRLARPEDAFWQSSDAKECHTVLGWTKDTFDEQDGKRAHELIGRACVEDRETWERQERALVEFYQRFFTARQIAPVLNLVSVTPSRVPSHLWPSKRGTLLVEELDPVPTIQSHAENADFGMINPVTFPLRSLIWAGLSGREKSRLRIARVQAHRQFGCTPTTYTRLFEVDPRLDIPEIRRGHVPGMSSALIGQGADLRVHAPMIQLWKIYANGMVDLVNIETKRDSGLALGVRWTTQRFSDLITHDPYFACAFLEFEKGRRTV